MAEGNKLPNMPIELSHYHSTITIGCNRKNHTYSNIVVGCDNNNIVLTSGLFMVPKTIRAAKGKFRIVGKDAVSEIHKNIANDGAFVITSNARIYRTLVGHSASTVKMESLAQMYYYSIGTGNPESSFSFVGEPALSDQILVIRGDSAFVVEGSNASIFVNKNTSSDSIIPIIGVALANHISYARSDGECEIVGSVEATQYRYDTYIPSDDDIFMTVDGENFVTVRSDDNGV